MAVQDWPLPVSGFFGLLGIEEATFFLSGESTNSVTAGGEVIVHRRGTRLWQGEVVLGKSEPEAIAAQDTLIESLLEPGASFMVYDRRQPAPQDPAYPAGINWSAQSVTIQSLTPGNRELSLQGLPPNFTLRRGQKIGFQYLASPVRFAIHRIMNATVSADGTGATAPFEVTPFLRPGVVVGASVILDRPQLRAKLLSFKPGPGRSSLTQGGSFTWQQTLGGGV
ncbi:hypothetical protein [Roseovarius sp. 217]|uniref:hypothetical protein n=1 Tax=Roseovarius sp. (strain 217) TaxID=314264 RepID=UPI00031F6EF5|nr:hypothetical protein [Roseovarius sp. 217]